jgi:hypothetical protein
VGNDDDNVPRSVRLADLLVVFSALLHNIVSSFQAFTEELLELSVYNANRETKVSKAWQQFTQDLEKMEDKNG